jgi:hypothetical protein
VCRDLLGKVISRKIGPNPNSKRAEATHRARDRNYTSLWAFREATANSSEKAEVAAATMRLLYASPNCFFYSIQSYVHPFLSLGKSRYSSRFKTAGIRLPKHFDIRCNRNAKKKSSFALKRQRG